MVLAELEMAHDCFGQTVAHESEIDEPWGHFDLLGAERVAEILGLFAFAGIQHWGPHHFRQFIEMIRRVIVRAGGGLLAADLMF